MLAYNGGVLRGRATSSRDQGSEFDAPMELSRLCNDITTSDITTIEESSGCTWV
jgi:hypothetical protein